MNITVLGAGSGACAAAVDLKLRGFNVEMCSTFQPDVETNLNAIEESGGIRYHGCLGDGFVDIDTSYDPYALKKSDLIMIVTIAAGYEHYARTCGRYFEPGQTIFLSPGYIGGSIQFQNLLKSEIVDNGHQGRPYICESNNLAFVCRQLRPGEVRIFRKTKYLTLGVLPSMHSFEVFDIVRQVYPFMKLADNVLESGMLNPNLVLHPAGMVMNAGWIESTGGNFNYYSQGITPAVARVMEAFEEERLAICNALGVKTLDFLRYYKESGYTSPEASGIYEAVRFSEPNKDIRAPPSLDHRYLSEDVGFGLVPLRAIAKIANVRTEVIDALIHLSSALTGVDYFKEGLSAEKMGIDGMSTEAFLSLVKRG